jgi:hypothetical protein
MHVMKGKLAEAMAICEWSPSTPMAQGVGMRCFARTSPGT